jgi:FAD/FMN-containing dehydrogenase
VSTPTVGQDVGAGSEASVQDLRRLLHGKVLTPTDAGYDDARKAWNAMVDKRPALIAQPLDADEVATAIAHARAHDLEIGIRCGGHSVLGQAIPEGGLEIDLSRMSAVRVDPDRRLAFVQGGALLRNLDEASFAHGLGTTAGNVSHTGVGGLTLGGGMGWLARQLGMACDNVVSYEVVTADGSQLTASADDNPDLYWGLRGGGGNFGVVTEFAFRLHPIVNQALAVDFFYPPDTAREIVHAFRELAPEAPPEATVTVWVGTAGPWPFLPEELHGKDLVSLGFVFAGETERARSLIPTYRAVAEPIAEAIEESTYLELQTGADEPMKPGLRRYWKGHYLRDLPEEAIDAFIARGGPVAEGEWRSNGSLTGYGGEIGKVGIGETAFSHRDAKFEFITTAGWEDPVEDEWRMAAPRRFAAAMMPFASGVYVNGLSDEGLAGVRHAYYAETLARLTAVKDRYDPDNVFHLNHNITPSRTTPSASG